MKTFNGECPKNARIKIDYSVKPTKVTFEYPDKKNQITGSMFGMILLCWFIILAIYFVGTAAVEDFQGDFGEGQYQTFRYTECYSHYNLNYKEIIDNTCSLYARNLTWGYPQWDLIMTWQKALYENQGMDIKSIKPRGNFKGILLFTGLYFLLIFGIPSVIYFPLRKKWNKLYPKSQAFFSRKKKMFFHPSTPFKDEKEKYFEVPYFSNIQLTYKATKDFSKYLRFIEIHEYPFFTWREHKHKTKNGKRRRIKAGYKKKNEFIWYARFYYTEKPKIGKLEVTFY